MWRACIEKIAQETLVMVRLSPLSDARSPCRSKLKYVSKSLHFESPDYIHPT